MDLYRFDCFPSRLPQRALHTGKPGKKPPKQTTKKTFCFTHTPLLFWPPLLLRFDNRLEQNPKLISHASIHNNPGSRKRVMQDHCSAKTLSRFYFLLKSCQNCVSGHCWLLFCSVKQWLLQKVIRCCERREGVGGFPYFALVGRWLAGEVRQWREIVSCMAIN